MGTRDPLLKKKQEQFFSTYIHDSRIVIADSGATSRATLASTLIQMGAQITNIKLAATYEAAVQEIENHKPRVVVCDYNLGSKCGLDLLQELRHQGQENKESLFILVTGNTSQSAVARAAEEDVDSFILKPFTQESLKKSMLTTALAKLDPPEYRKVIDEGKKLMIEGNFDGAIAQFEKAKTLDPNPSLACFYLGQANLMKKMIGDAQTKYAEGLGYNKIHYKCLVGLYEVLMSQNRHKEAYDIIKKISHYFPANPQRLNAVIRLAIMTQSYEDVERYYQIFTGIEARNEEMIKYICAALVVCGKYYLQRNLGSRAVELFQKAAVSASGRTKILREIIQTLIEFKMVKEAQEYLKRFPSETHLQPDFLIADFLVLDKMGTAFKVIARGRELITSKVNDPLVYRIMIRRSQEAGLGPAVQDLLRDATALWPAQGEVFQNEAKAPPTPV